MTKRTKRNALCELPSSPLPNPDPGAVLLALGKSNVGKRDDEKHASVLGYFAGLDGRPALVPALALLLVLEELADSRRRVRIDDVLPHFPSDVLSPCLSLLRAHSFVTNDGREITLHRSPRDAAKKGA